MLSLRMLETLKALAIKNVSSTAIDTYVENCYRYYSKTYHTPLHIAREAITMEEAVLIYMEDHLADKTAEEIAELKKEYVKKEEPVFVDLEVSEVVEALDDEAWIAQQTELLRQKEKKAKQSQEEIVKKTHEAIEKFSKELKNFQVDD